MGLAAAAAAAATVRRIRKWQSRRRFVPVCISSIFSSLGIAAAGRCDDAICLCVEAAIDSSTARATVT